jgi:hypothetical protein
MRRSIRRFPATGVLSTSLPEDVFSLIDVQLQILFDTFNGKENHSQSDKNVKDLTADGVLAILGELRTIQKSSGLSLMTTFETCCGAANDFWRMSEKMEKAMGMLSKNMKLFGGKQFARISSEAEDIVSLFSNDAVFAAERLQVFVMRDLNNNTSISRDMFSPEWEDQWTRNEVARRLLETFNAFLIDCKERLCNEFLYHKALTACAKSLVCFYIRCMVEKADNVRKRKKRDRLKMKKERRAFNNPDRAVLRMKGDIEMIKNFLFDKAEESTTLARIIADELHFLDLIYECISTSNMNSIDTFIVVIHKKTGADALVTRCFVRDLWLLVKEKEEQKSVRKTLDELQPDLERVSLGIESRSSLQNALEPSSFVQIDEMLKIMYEDRLAQGMLGEYLTFLNPVNNEGVEIVGNAIKSMSLAIKEMTKP